MAKMSREEAKLAKFNAKREKADNKSLAKAAAQEARMHKIEARQEDLAQFEEKFGRVSAQGPIGGRKVEIFDKGFVRVGKIGPSAPEKLLGVSGQADISKKSALGRFAMGTLVMYSNIAFTPNRRGEIHMAITTDRQTYSLKSELPMQFELESFYQIMASAESILESRKSSTGQALASAPDIAQQLKQIAELHAQGVLNDDEFSAAKAKLLGNS